MTNQRGRPAGNKWIGQHMTDPDIEIAMIARAQGAFAFGPIADPHALEPALTEAMNAVLARGVAVVDVRVRPAYDPATTRTMLSGVKP